MKEIYIQTRKFVLSLLDILTRKKGIGVRINGVKLRVPGKLFHYYADDYEQENFLFLQANTRPGAVCLDIGAHAGIYSVVMLKMGAAKVFSFEPTPSSFKILKKTIALNHCGEHVTVLPVAVAGQSGTTDFFLNRGNYIGNEGTKIAEANSLINVDFGKKIIKQAIRVSTTTIDEFAETHQIKIDLIKIDVEGAEEEVLKGATRTMRKDRPCGIISVHNFAFRKKEQALAAIWQTLIDHNMQPLLNKVPLSWEQFLSMSGEDIFDFHFKPKEI